MGVVAKAAALMFLLGLTAVSARDERSLTDFESGNPDEEYILPDPAMNHVASLREKLVLAEAKIKNLTEGIVTSNMEAEIFKRQLADTQLRLEALGLSTMNADHSQLESRLLQAVRELRVLKEKNQAAAEQLASLSEAITVLLKSANQINPQARMGVEAEMRKTAEILGAAISASPDAIEPGIQDALVVDYKEDLSLVVANVGSKHGVNIGMPFRIIRDGRLIGFAKVIDVRERIAGAVIQDLTSDNVKVEKGDILKVDARK